MAQSLFDRFLKPTGGQVHVVAVAGPTNVQQHLFQVVDLCHSGATEEVPWHRIFGNATLPQVNVYLTIVRNDVAKSEVHLGNPANVTAIAPSLTQLILQNQVVRYLTPFFHQRFGHRSTVEQDALVLDIGIVIVPIQASGRLT